MRNHRLGGRSTTRMASVLITSVMLLSASACDQCQSDADCDDGVWCNGKETCSCLDCEIPVFRCVPGAPPCCSLDFGSCEDGETMAKLCNENDEQCNIDASDCQTDDDCDDGIWCNGNEGCATNTFHVADFDPAVHGDEQPQAHVCVPREPPCLRFMTSCAENELSCPCTADSDCDDGLLCTGVEVCVDGGCMAGPGPCLELACDGQFTCGEMQGCSCVVKPPDIP